MSTLRKFYVVYKKYQAPGTDYMIIEAIGKHEAKLKFMASNVKYDSILYVMT